MGLADEEKKNLALGALGSIVEGNAREYLSGKGHKIRMLLSPILLPLKYRLYIDSILTIACTITHTHTPHRFTPWHAYRAAKPAAYAAYCRVPRSRSTAEVRELLAHTAGSAHYGDVAAPEV